MNKNCFKYLLCVLERLGFSFFLMVQNGRVQVALSVFADNENLYIVIDSFFSFSF
jgi:hypothetical protein